MSITVKTYKPDGRLHRQYEAMVIAETDEWLMINIPIGTPIVDNIKEAQHFRHRDCIGLINNTEYYNVFFEFGRAGAFHRIYVNLATPATWSDELVEWTDLELDVIQTRDDPIRIDDIAEYTQAIKDGHISPEVAAICDRNRVLLEKCIKEQKFPFMRLSYAEVTNKTKRKLADGARGRLAYLMLAAASLLLSSEVVVDIL